MMIVFIFSLGMRFLRHGMRVSTGSTIETVEFWELVFECLNFCYGNYVLLMLSTWSWTNGNFAPLRIATCLSRQQCVVDIAGGQW